MLQKKLRDRRGTTMVELVVCMALLGILSVAVVQIVRPGAQVYAQMQRLNRAQALSDAVMTSLRTELGQAQGYLRMAQAPLKEEDAASTNVFAEKIVDADHPQDHTFGNALEYVVASRDVSKVVILDAGYLPDTFKASSGGTPGKQLAQKQEGGQLHTRYYNVPSPVGSPIIHTDASGKETAYDYAEAFADKSYMDFVVKLEFKICNVRIEQVGEEPDAPKISYVRAITAEVKIAEDLDSLEPVYTRTDVIPLPYEPMLIYNRDQWKN